MDCSDCTSSSCPILCFCDKTWRGLLNLHREEKNLPKDQYLVHEKEKTGSVFILEKGKLKSIFTTKGGKQEHIIRFMDPGFIIGCFEESNNTNCNFSILAAEHSIVCAFPYSIFHEILSTNGQLAHRLLLQIIRELGEIDRHQKKKHRLQLHKIR